MVTRASAKPASSKRRLELARRVIDLDDRELATVVEVADGRVVGGRRVVGGARLFVRQRVDERERPAGLEPTANDAEEVGKPGARDVAQPEAGEHRIDLPIGFSPCVAYVKVRPQLVRDEALTRALERGRRPVVEGQLAFRGKERRPPAGPCRELDDLAPDRKLVEPAPGDVELGVPRCVVDRPALVAPTAQVPVVVLGGAGLVVGEHGRVDVGGGGRGGPSAAQRRP